MKFDEDVAEWMEFAKADLMTAELLLSLERYPRATEIICYHTQQAAEKALKAFLVANEIEPPKIHNLTQLCEMSEEFEPSFSEMARRCGFLTKYGIAPKYPHGVDISEDDAKMALNYAQIIYEKIEKYLMNMNIAEPFDGLFLIDLPQKLDGFEQFISAWFFKDTLGRRVLVDPGPASTIDDLCAVLQTLTDDLDIILLTHIHLDHSGGVGQLLQKYPSAKIIVSDRGKKHLISPEKLWKASVETLGDVALAYQMPVPVSGEKFIDGDVEKIEIFETPGHAPHHISFRVPFGDINLFFVGEAAGMTLPCKSRYLRPTTPAKFDGDAALASLDLLIDVCGAGDVLCYSHFGVDNSNSALDALTAAKIQISLWAESVSKGLAEGKDLEAIRDLLIQKDPLLSEFSSLSPTLQKRELAFMKNSLQGIKGWVL